MPPTAPLFAPIRSPLGRIALWAAILTAASWLVVLSEAAPALRVPVVLAFCLAAPGAALVGPLRLRNPIMEATLSIAASIALLILVSYGMLLWGSWSTTPLLFSLTVPVVVGVAAELLRPGPSVES
jgi:hypothetical protein